MATTEDSAIRSQLVTTLRGGHAYAPFDEIAASIPIAYRFQPPAGKGKSAWQIVEHMRIALEDLVEFVDNESGQYRVKAWPEEYWPQKGAPENPAGWERSLEGVRAALKKMESLIEDPKRGLTEPFSWGNGQTLLHEALLAIEHNAYHLGELVELAESVS